MTQYEWSRPRPQRQAVVTGLGAVSSLAPTAGELWQRLLADESANRQVSAGIQDLI